MLIIIQIKSNQLYQLYQSSPWNMYVTYILTSFMAEIRCTVDVSVFCGETYFLLDSEGSKTCCGVVYYKAFATVRRLNLNISHWNVKHTFNFFYKLYDGAGT